MAKADIIPSRGAVVEPLLLEVTRELTPDDLARLVNAPKVGVPILQKLRATHHRQASLLAEGKAVHEVAIIVGCTPQRITQLLQDPTFIELLTYYKDQISAGMITDAARLKDKIVDLGEMAVDEMVERLEDDQRRKNMPIGEIRKIAEFAMDRTVAPPVATNNTPAVPTTITFNFGTKLRADESLLSKEEFIEAKVEEEAEVPLAKHSPLANPSPAAQPTETITGDEDLLG